ncbi:MULTISPECIES: glutamine-hydrolyzing carbamoyl-phosphate synthase small subunit [Methylobacterium]|jgi:carbamoyl-phosphate synthase small subunit|uniref:Carbamoyl phosphate synthase small chain n=1 Tax=Methylobacterium radiotolerans (strain ATCC 27329 / DSM 1819 / JCM 2831 / NBRC 15690 / NCIMB 10815 / 0-1) TaxID=426355 RepID=B1LVD6_METRJ|nr:MULTISPECIES: glutamine-hydrolyzing carbamoyl-phosphate synthase small subunit [Methylobacterium]ACB22581.1 carbamoyl-phosphate synthase, small subunit [Methylobacterium radiotolerans JCM 2831]KTS04393.1 carbamoyl-phosphate synthase [Methylobacterium radiotolerans]KTS50764.1 carbamoyl-phosphate synthase [Methylobacterium radiotolerans]KZC00709.1 Carbamoyl-phosphate synthase small chain [Methylobacterium radiotolerans]MBY0255696.1 glutamine-hydrolyzing carbamoyl-phosphate synthase small subu
MLQDAAAHAPEPQAPEPWAEPVATALLVLADGTILEGFGIGQTGVADGEVCFNTAMTGYQEILTDPSYAGQIVTFTFPHIGNVGTNDEDLESLEAAPASGVRGTVVASAVTNPSNWRSSSHLDGWLRARGIVGITGVDTRALTARIRDQGMPNAVIANDPEGKFDREALKARAAALAPMEGLDLVPPVTSRASSEWSETVWALGNGYGKRAPGEGLKVVAIDYGVKRNILRLLAQAGCDVTVVPATTTADEILALKPDGVFLSNGPGDPAATGAYAVPVIRKLLDEKVPTFGICLGHQLMGLALGGRTVKMGQGHHGANHPVKDKTTGKVEIVSMNHGFAVDPGSLPETAVETHVSLFDGSNCGLTLTDRPAFSVQHHPEASPGPRDSHYLFERFVTLMRSGAPETAKGA